MSRLNTFYSRLNTSRLAYRLLPECNWDFSGASQEVRWLTKYVTGQDPEESNMPDKLSAQTQKEITQLINQRVEWHKPLQYIIGTQPFCNLEIKTKVPVLIPRWETEEWTLRLIELLKPKLKYMMMSSSPFRILEIGVGTGCISLALSAHLPRRSAIIYGFDIDDSAVELANINLFKLKNQLRNNVQFGTADVRNPSSLAPYLRTAGWPKFDLIISNPPYISHLEYDQLPNSVKQWEEPRALVGGVTGTNIHEFIIHAATRVLLDKRPDTANDQSLPLIMMEIGGSAQIAPLTEYLLNHGFGDVETWKDGAGKERVIIAKTVKIEEYVKPPAEGEELEKEKERIEKMRRYRSEGSQERLDIRRTKRGYRPENLPWERW